MIFRFYLLLLYNKDEDLVLWNLLESESEVAQSCPTLFDTLHCSLPGSSIHEIFQVRILEWIAISFSSRSSRLRDWTQVSCIVGRRFTIWAISPEIGMKSMIIAFFIIFM